MAPDDDGDGLALARGVGVGVRVGVGIGARLARLGAGAGAAGRRALGRPSSDLPEFDMLRPKNPRDDISVTAKGAATRTTTATFSSTGSDPDRRSPVRGRSGRSWSPRSR
ncbi:hypothetical protein GCM10027176_08710 [Actinoallomurus bryophytorum]|uniref:hypothetical protein n=1 Tax=Actinoallomurus bryophytorum TaxID=1490222 RepID=UPI00114E3E01|nr:hypothetical protein [Actinoallomurus bryophytorum]